MKKILLCTVMTVMLSLNVSSCTSKADIENTAEKTTDNVQTSETEGAAQTTEVEEPKDNGKTEDAALDQEETSSPALDTAKKYCKAAEYGPVGYDGHAYAVFNFKEDLMLESYDECEDYCEKREGHLAIINSDEENQFLYHFLKDNGMSAAFFGYTDQDQEGLWTWVDGSTGGYSNWCREKGHEQPNNTNGKENYAQFFKDSDDGTWNDAQFGSNSWRFICEWGDPPVKASRDEKKTTEAKETPTKPEKKRPKYEMGSFDFDDDFPPYWYETYPLLINEDGVTTMEVYESGDALAIDINGERYTTTYDIYGEEIGKCRHLYECVNGSELIVSYGIDQEAVLFNNANGGHGEYYPEANSYYQYSDAEEDEYICPGSDYRYLTRDDIDALELDIDGIKLARNEIYARHGRIFNSADLRDYFNSQSWYRGTVSAEDFDESVLNKYERANIELLTSYEGK